MDDEKLGLWCRSNNTFYYLESGPHAMVNHIDRLKTILISRDIISYSTKGMKKNEEPYKIMDVKEAKEKQYTIKPVYLNSHVRRMIERNEVKQSGPAWKQSTEESE